MTGSVSKAGTILPPKFYLQDFATIWYLIRWLQFWPLALKANVATSWKFGHQVQNLVIRWRHLHWFQCCPPGWVTCIATLPGIALLALSVGIDLVSSSARVTSVKFQKHDSVSDGHPDTKIGPGTPGSDKNTLYDMTCGQDHILTENIWFVWSKTSYSGDKWGCYLCGKDGRTTNKGR